MPLLLAGGHGPWPPPAVWSVLKVLLVASVLVSLRHLLPRLRLDWLMKVAWIFLIPLSLVNLFLVGPLMLLFPGFSGGGRDVRLAAPCQNWPRLPSTSPDCRLRRQRI